MTDATQAPRFRIDVRNINPGEIHDEVNKVQLYLSRFGYLNDKYEPKRLDQPTQSALRAFQARARVKVTGAIDELTAQALEMPRCGVPNFSITGLSSADDQFALEGCSYKGHSTPLTYAFDKPPKTFTVGDITEAFVSAFDQWKKHITPITFAQVALSVHPLFTFGWVVRDHGDGQPFDGVGNVVGHAFGPPDCGGTFTGTCHFDDEDGWALFHSSASHDIETVALHEIGHLLGLHHSNDENAVMFEFYEGSRRWLTQNDIDAIRALYA